MAVMFLQAAIQDLDNADQALERPDSPPDFKVAAGCIVEAIETAVEEFTLELSTASELPRFDDLANFTRRARTMALDLYSQHLRERYGGSHDRGKGMAFAKSVQRLFNAIQTHRRLLQHVEALEQAKVSSHADIIALSSTFIEIGSALENLPGAVRELLHSLLD